MPLVEANPRVSIKNILFATDFSECAQAALPFAAFFARQYHANLCLAHVVPPDVRLDISVEPPPAEQDTALRDARQDMEELTRSELLKDLPHDSLVEKGDLWEVLEHMLAEKKADLIVLGTHGRGGLRKLVLGSVAEQIMRLAPCPVLTVGPAVQPRIVEDIRTVVFATEFLTGSVHALPYALGIAERHNARLVLLHALSVPGEIPVASLEPMEAECMRELHQLVPADATCKVECEIAFGAPAEVILRDAERRRADLIVTGVHPTAHAWAATHLAWATAHQVIAHAHCPVLTVRG